MNIGELVSYLLTPVCQIALIMGLAELAKKMGIPHKYIPLIDLGLGLISGIFVYGNLVGMVEAVVLGIALGLSACGLFSGIKNFLEQ